MSSILITGTNSGIGLGLVKLFASDPKISHVFGTVRPSADAAKLNEFAQQHKNKVHVIKIDPANLESAKSGAKEVEKILGGKGLDYLINNAGTYTFNPSVLEVTDQNLLLNFNANVVTAHHISVAFFPLLEKGTEKKVLNVTTLVGSITECDGRYPFPLPAYAVSKAALNMLTKWYANEFGPKGFIFVPISPGYVAVEKNENAPGAITVQESTEGIRKVLYSLTAKDNGVFYSYDGTIHPW
eukprot:Phypoly_transcript_11037.p1 GENE.Phypoly_transcript_11037~~Phypoly_transcript_11037.p1  ORF type:complete len:241 (+),score=50.81 Phypoly_transcript_11037:467-1189(+)